MKKTLFALLACAAVAQAASLGWSITNVKYATEDGITTNVTTGSYSAYLFITSVTSGTVSDITTTTQGEILDSLASAHEDGSNWGSTASTLAQASASNSLNTGNGTWTVTTDIEGFSAGDSVTAFAVIFDATDIANANNYYVVNEKTLTINSATGTKSIAFLSQATNSGAKIDSSSVSWQSIASSPTTPEPATTTLSLLALAGLAARRRH